MTTICGLSDIDIYMLYYLDIKSVLNLATVSKDYNVLITNLDFIKDVYLLKSKCVNINKGNIVYYASQFNCISLLQWLYDSANEFIYTCSAIDSAASRGNIDVLIWFDKFVHDFKYSQSGINLAAAYGYVEILDWFDKSKHEFKYSHNAIQWAIMFDHIKILEWFKQSSHKIIIRDAITHAENIGKQNIVEWLQNNY